VNNFIVQGNGINGGNVTINAPIFVKLLTGTKIAKGAKVQITPTKIMPVLKLGSINTCYVRNYPMNNGETKSLFVSQDTALNFMVYPNPSNGILNIQFHDFSPKNYALYDILGKLLLSGITNENLTTLNISTLSSGIYMLNINTMNSSQYIKIIRQ
jgi:hypothetical protein